MIEKGAIKKFRKRIYSKDVFYKLHSNLKKSGKTLPKNFRSKKTPSMKTCWKQLMVLCSFFIPMLQVFPFFIKSVLALCCCLLCVDLFSSKTHTYGMKNKSLLAAKSKYFTEKYGARENILRRKGDTKWDYQQIRNLIKERPKNPMKSLRWIVLIRDLAGVTQWLQNKKFEG